MKRSRILLTLALALALGAGTFAFQAFSEESDPPFGSHGMHRMGRGMMGMGPGMMGSSATAGEMDVIHELFASHARIRRNVTNLANGIRTVTESDDPRIARLIKDHVAAMDRRVKAADDPGLPIESEALHSIFRDSRKIETAIEVTDKGVIVMQTSADPRTVAALQQHAGEVSDFVRAGMPAMHAAMMRNGMHGHAPMMHGMPGRGPSH